MSFTLLTLILIHVSNIGVNAKFKKNFGRSSTASVTDPLLLELDEALAEAGLSTNQESNVSEDYEGTLLSSPTRNKRIAFLFDSTLTAFLMMGNLSPV